MTLLFMIMLLISTMILKISFIMNSKMKLNSEKMSPFECGFNPNYYKRKHFSLQFFLISILFLIFDVEISLLMPMIMSIKLSNIMSWYISSMIFLLILIMGLFYEWKYGSLNWIE